MALFCYSLISFTIGVLSGVQAVFEKYQKSRFRAIQTFPALIYLVVRGAVSVGAFLALYLSSFYWSSLIYQKPLLWAIICGTGAEYLLRSTVFLREKKGATGDVEALMLGPLDLLKWFQDLFLKMVEEKLTPLDVLVARHKIEFLKRNMPSGSFEELCETVVRNLAGFEHDLPEQVKIIGDGVIRFKGLYAQENGADDEAFKHKLGHLILNRLGEEGFIELASKAEERSEKS